MNKIRILIVDDHTVVRDGLSAMLGREEDMTVVGEASNGLEAVDQAANRGADNQTARTDLDRLKISIANEFVDFRPTNSQLGAGFLD